MVLRDREHVDGGQSRLDRLRRKRVTVAAWVAVGSNQRRRRAERQGERGDEDGRRCGSNSQADHCEPEENDTFMAALAVTPAG